VGNVLTNPEFQSSLLVAGQPGFAPALAALLASPQGSNVPAAGQSNILWILDSASQNLGSMDQQGIDFTANYDWDMGAWGEWNVGITGDYKIHQILTIPGTAPVDTYDTDGEPLAFRLRWRAHLGWSQDGFDASVFTDYTSHVSSNNPLPPASYLGDYPNYSNKVPAEFLFDVALGYNTRDEPANDDLKNLSLQLVVNNIFDRPPPFAYNISSSTMGLLGFLPSLYSPYGRTISFTVTKQW
jgi:iron complex outermembrane recepter protein